METIFSTDSGSLGEQERVVSHLYTLVTVSRNNREEFLNGSRFRNDTYAKLKES